MPRNGVAIQSRWDIAVLQAIKDGQDRPALLQRHCPQIPRRTLYRRLKHLQQAGLIEPVAQPPATLRLTDFGNRWLQAVQRLAAAGLSEDHIVRLCPLLRCPCRLRALELLLRHPTRPRLLIVGLRVSRKQVFEHLRRLQGLRVVRRKVVPTRPVQVHYHLTPQGERIIRALLEARALLEDDAPAVIPLSDLRKND